jgi:hypothetical protein
MKFLKLKLNGVPESKNDVVVKWVLVIDNEQDLMQYHQHDAYCNMQSFMSLEREPNGGGIKTSHLAAVDTRSLSMVRMIQAKQITLAEGEKMYPIIEVAKITDQKYLSMLKYILNYGAIRINPAGGWCGLQGFIKTWNAEILEEVNKDSIGFPTDDDAIQADTIILENAHPEYSGYVNRLAKNTITNCGTVATIYNLKEVDRDYVFKCLSNCKNILIDSQLQDESQVEDFIKLFSLLKRKNVYLLLDKENEGKIRSNKLFSRLNDIHNIVFPSTH